MNIIRTLLTTVLLSSYTIATASAVATYSPRTPQNSASSHEQEARYQPPAVPEGEPIIILSIDGGGVRGIVPARLIDYIEKQTGQKITTLVDVFGGTSAGAIVAGLLNVPDAQGKQRYTAADALGFSNDVIKKLFNNTAFRSVRTLGGLAGSKYSAKPLEEALEKLTFKAKLSTTIKPVVIPSFDLTRNQVFVFTTRNAKDWPALLDFLLEDAIRASTAAPVYFKAHELTLKSGAKVVLTDGGVIAMSPALLTFAEAQTLYPGRKYYLISLSTGRNTELKPMQAKGWSAGGAPKMLGPLLDATLAGQLSAVDQILKQTPNLTYMRVDVNLPKECTSLDNASAKNIKCLEDFADQAKNSATMQKVISDLKEMHQKRQPAQQQSWQKANAPTQGTVRPSRPTSAPVYGR